MIVALTADEEGGDYNGVEWLLKNHRPLIEAEFGINEGGGGQIRNGKKLLNAVQASEKIYQSFLLEVKNKGGHSSGIFGDIDDSRAHGKDERVGVKAFYDGQEYLYRLVKAFTSAGARGRQAANQC